MGRLFYRTSEHTLVLRNVHGTVHIYVPPTLCRVTCGGRCIAVFFTRIHREDRQF